MNRTQIYLTQKQTEIVAARAADADVSKAAMIRRLLDEALELDDGKQARESAFRATAGVIPDADDWPSWLASVRGAGADARLLKLDR